MEPKDWLGVGMFGLSILGAVTSYVKAISDVRSEITTAIADLAEKLRDESRNQYATKEEAKFQHEILTEIKLDLKEIKRKLESNRLV